MLRLISGRPLGCLPAVTFILLFALTSPAAAQTGMIKGRVVDAQNQPVEDAKITIEFTGGMNRRFEVKTNKKGDFIQIGLQSGVYNVSAQKDKVGYQAFEGVRVRLGQPAEVNFQLTPGGGPPASKEDIAKATELRKLFDEGVTASKAGSFDEAVAKFTQASTLIPNCYDCYYNMGYAYGQKKEYDQAEAAFKKAIEIKPDYVEAYNGLATIYNTQKKFDLAVQASQKAAELGGGAAAGGGNVDSLYNQGVINWNAGKIADARKNFEDALKLNPDHADSHYQLGMALLNEGKMPEAAAEFEAYLKLAPDGQYAAQAKAFVGQLKK